MRSNFTNYNLRNGTLYIPHSSTMASRYRSICTPASRILISMATPSPKPTLAPSFTPRSSPTTVSRSSSRRGCVQSLLPLQPAVSSARLTSCDSKGTTSLSQPLRLCFPVQTREFDIFSSARRLLMGRSMTMAGVAATKVIPPAYAFCISRLGSYRNIFKIHPLAPEDEKKDHDYSPTAWKAIKTAKVIAIEQRLKYIEPECLMLALLGPEECIAKDVLVEAKCDINLMKTKMHKFLRRQPKTTDGVLKKAKNIILNGGWSSRVTKGSSLHEVNADPESHLHSLLSEANTHRINMGDDLIGEEHLVRAYHKVLKFVREDDLKSAVEAIRSNLKKKEDHLKEEEITLTRMEEKTGKR